MKKPIIAVVLILLICDYGYCGFVVSGTDLLDACLGYTGSLKTNSANDGYCVGYILGSHDGVSIESRAIDKDFICPPDGVKSSQLALIVKKYLQVHPETLHLPASKLVGLSLIEAFPCK